MSKLTESIQGLVEPVLIELGYELVDLQYGREGGVTSCGCLSTGRKASALMTAKG